MLASVYARPNVFPAKSQEKENANGQNLKAPIKIKVLHTELLGTICEVDTLTQSKGIAEHHLVSEPYPYKK